MYRKIVIWIGKKDRENTKALERLEGSPCISAVQQLKLAKQPINYGETESPPPQPRITINFTLTTSFNTRAPRSLFR